MVVDRRPSEIHVVHPRTQQELPGGPYSWLPHKSTLPGWVALPADNNKVIPHFLYWPHKHCKLSMTSAQIELSLTSLRNSWFGREFHPTFDNLQCIRSVQVVPKMLKKEFIFIWADNFNRYNIHCSFSSICKYVLSCFKSVKWNSTALYIYLYISLPTKWDVCQLCIEVAPVAISFSHCWSSI